jgi:hypothetical protein
MKLGVSGVGKTSEMPGKSPDTIKKFETEKSSFSFNTSLVVFDSEWSGYYLEDASVSK